MNILKLTMGIIILLLTGCSEVDMKSENCTEAMLSENEMIKYDGQEIGCRFFLEVYYFRNRQFFLLGNHCADMMSYPVDCEGNTLCENGMDSECEDFYDNAEKIGIVGISK